MASRVLSVEQLQRAASACLEINDDLEVIDVVKAEAEGYITGFMSENTRVTVVVKLPDGSIKDLKIFVKLLPYDEELKCDSIKQLKMFAKEWNFYSLIIPEFNRFGYNLSTPRCYHGSEEFVMLEDLSNCTFKVPDPTQDFDYNHCSLVMKLLATLHAASLTYEEKISRERKVPYRLLDDGRFILEDFLMEVVQSQGITFSFVSSCLDAMKHLLDQVPKYKNNEELLTDIKENLHEEMERIKIILSSSKTVRHTICHGDVWANNLLFKYGPDGKPTEVKIVDFQCYRYVEPTSDVMIFLYLSCNQRFRQKFEKKLLSLYHSTFVQLLCESDLPETLFPEKDFLESCEIMRKVGRFYAAVNGQVIFLPPARLSRGMFTNADPVDVLKNRGIWMSEIYRVDDSYRSRMSEALEDFVDNNIIPTL